VHIVSGPGGLLFARATHAFAWQGSETPQSASAVHASSLFFGAGSLQAKRAVGSALSLGAGALELRGRASALASGSGVGGAGVGGGMVTSAAVGAGVAWLQPASSQAVAVRERRRFTTASCRSLPVA
jgi:hypothetical protein